MNLENAVITADSAHAQPETAEYVAGCKDNGNREAQRFGGRGFCAAPSASAREPSSRQARLIS